MTYYLAVADATIARNNDEIETHIIGGFDTVEDARACLLKMVRHFLHVMGYDENDDYKNLDDYDAIELFDKRNRFGYWLIEEDIQSPEDFISNYCGSRILFSGGEEVPPQEVEVAPLEGGVRHRTAIAADNEVDAILAIANRIKSEAEIAALKEDIAATLARLSETTTQPQHDD
jgi:hypothetical protein